MFQQYGGFQDLKRFFEGEKEDENEKDSIKEVGSGEKEEKMFQREEQRHEVKSRSEKSKVNLIQISFEEDFLHQHLISFEKQLQKYIETLIKQHKPPLSFFNDTLLFPHPPSSSSSNMPFIQSIQSHPFLTHQQQLQFSKDLQTQDKFVQFLKEIQKHFLHLPTLQIFYIAFLVWQSYIQIRRPLLKINDIATFAQKFAEKHFNELYGGQRIVFLVGKNINEQLKMPQKIIKDGFANFLKYFCQTAYLIIEEYFENPYFEDSLKRNREEENQFELDSGSEEIYSETENSSEDGNFRQWPCKARKFI